MMHCHHGSKHHHARTSSTFGSSDSLVRMFDDPETATAGKRQRSRRFFLRAGHVGQLGGATRAEWVGVKCRVASFITRRLRLEVNEAKRAVLGPWTRRERRRCLAGLSGGGRAVGHRVHRGVGSARGRRGEAIVVQCRDFAEPSGLAWWTEDPAARRAI